MKNTILIILCIATLGVHAQVADTSKGKIADTVNQDAGTPHSKLASWLVPTGLVAYGGLSFVVKPIRNVDYWFKGEAAGSNVNMASKLSDYLQIAPGVAVYALNLFGDEGKDRFWDRTAMLALSGTILTITDGTKYLAHRVRPYGTDPLSFPSRHTGAAFVAAQFMAEEYGEKSPWYSVAAYTCATATGVLRVYGHAHWFSDCVAGAGLGILSVKTAYWLYPHIKKALTHKDKHGRSTSIMPGYYYGAPGVSFAMRL
ncbi:MAG: phosphatase PAP2 family protein [Bacteroidetes bacterium]|nr:phosphatase PAP2 family protein [Bacteroidota bacterium]